MIITIKTVISFKMPEEHEEEETFRETTDISDGWVKTEDSAWTSYTKEQTVRSEVTKYEEE